MTESMAVHGMPPSMGLETLPLLGGARPDPAKSSRDIFPLSKPPLFKVPPGFSRRSAQRLSRKAREIETVREAVDGLNWASGHGFLHEDDGTADGLQQEVLQRIQCLAKEAGNLGELERLPQPEAALRELLKGKSEYHQPEVPVALAPYNLEHVSLPESLHGLPDAQSLLPPDIRQYLQGCELMLKDGPPEAVAPPYWDPVLANNEKHYRQFIQKLNSIGFLKYTRTPKNQVGVFFVHKSDKKKIRLIVDARSTNALFKEPPGVELCSSEGFSRIEVQLTEQAQPGSKEFFDELASMDLYVGLSDVKDCFHRLRQPDWLAEYFCFKPVRAGWVGLTGEKLQGVTLRSRDWIYPMPGSLCMGFSWSLFFSQKINEYQCSLTSSLSTSHLISDKGEPVVFRSEACRVDPSSSMRHYVYVDNLGVLSPHEGVVSKSLQELDEHFTERGLLLHPGEVKTGNVKALGTILDGKNKCSKVSPERFHRVRQAVRGVLRRAKISGKCLEVVIGHCTFCGLNNRLTLSIFHSCYKFIQACYYEPVPLWTSARDELRGFAGLMIFLRAEWWRPWNNLVCCSDASKVGFGICTSFWDREDVAKVGRIKERTRFKRSSGHSARESALTSAGFVKDLITGDWKAGLIDGEQYLEQSGWTLDETFEEVPAKHLHHDLWEPKLWGRWKYDDDIIVLEARAAVKALRRVALSVFGVHVRQLFLLDNMSLVLALDRCRSRQHKLLKQVRIFCAYCLARGIQPAVRWIPSELNASDEPSRYGTNESSKLLTSLIPGHGTKEEPGPGPTVESEARSFDKLKDSEEGVRVDSGHQAKSGGATASTLGGGVEAEVSEACVQRSRRDARGFSTNNSAGRFSLKLLRQQQLGRSGKDQDLGSQKEVSSQKVCEPASGWQEPARVDFSRKEVSEAHHRKHVRQGVQDVHGICRSSRDGPQGLKSGGYDIAGVYEQDVRGRASSLHGRPTHRRLPVPPPRVQQGWAAAHSPILESTERVAKAVSRTKPKTISLVDLVRPGLPYGAFRVPPNGSVCDAVPLYVQPTIRAFEMPCLQPDSSIPEHYQSMESSAESRRNGSHEQDRGVRCESAVGLPVSLDLDWTVAASHEEEISRAASLGLHLQSIPECLQEVQRNDENGALPLPFETQWSFSRQKSPLPESTRSSETWTMAVNKIDSQVREVSQISKELGDSAREDQDFLQPMRARSRGYHAWKKASAHGDLPRRNPKGHFFSHVH